MRKLGLREVTSPKSHSELHLKYNSSVLILQSGLLITVLERDGGKGRRVEGWGDSRLLIHIFRMSKRVWKFNKYILMLSFVILITKMSFHVLSTQFETTILTD